MHNLPFYVYLSSFTFDTNTYNRKMFSIFTEQVEFQEPVTFFCAEYTWDGHYSLVKRTYIKEFEAIIN